MRCCRALHASADHRGWGQPLLIRSCSYVGPLASGALDFNRDLTDPNGARDQAAPCPRGPG